MKRESVEKRRWREEACRFRNLWICSTNTCGKCGKCEIIWSASRSKITYTNHPEASLRMFIRILNSMAVFCLSYHAISFSRLLHFLSPRITNTIIPLLLCKFLRTLNTRRYVQCPCTAGRTKRNPLLVPPPFNIIWIILTLHARQQTSGHRETSENA